MTTVDEARLRILAAITRLGAEHVGIGELEPGRVLARDLIAGRDQPPFDVSAMDGWAMRFSDLEGGARLRAAGESAAGRPYSGALEVGQAVRIFTGAAVPQGADTVVIQEDASVTEGGVQVTTTPKPGANIRACGGDFRTGERLLRNGQALTAWSLALAAASGVGAMEVARRPRVLLLACGDELAVAGTPAEAHQIHDSVTPALAMRVRGWGAVARRAFAPDSLDALKAAITAADADLVVTIGGASVGDRDLVKPALAALGARRLVDKVAIRPGKPVFFAALPSGRPVLGLPGNPASAMVCAELFLWPILRAMQGGDPQQPLERLPLAAPLAANGLREHWMRARIMLDGEGCPTVAAFADQDSSLVSVLAAANALIRRPAAAPPAAADEPVEVLRL
jgi:molybdopterin molybdotransferase